MAETTTIVARLREALAGRVIAPDDPDYERARAVFPGGVDRRPAVIARVATADDVARVVSVARDTGLPLAVRSGGHTPYAVCDDGIVLDLADMRAMTVDPERRTAWAETGLTAGEYTATAGKYGLATGFGDTGSVGIGGITLGGGIGFLVRRYGLTIDDLLAAEVVTADGRLLRVDEHEHPDLFWAIRGGGGNFGVATRLHLRLHEVPTVVGGMLILPATADVIAGFLAAAQAAPDELSTIANVMPAPPMPFVPAEVHGQPVVFALVAYAGDAEAGERAIAPLRELAAPIADMVRPMAYPEMYQPDPDDYHPVAAGRTLFVDEFGRDTAETVLDHLRASTGQMSVAQLRVLGGAMARVPAEATAFAHRDRRIMVNIAALYGDPAEAATHEAWAGGFAAALRRGEDAAYVNFLDPGDPERVRAAYPAATWDRLAAVKRQYDPTNLFRLNHNIPPAAG